MKVLKRVVFSVHFLVLLGVAAFLLLPITWRVNFPIQFWIKQGFTFLLWISVFYLMLYLFVPRILYKGKSFLFIVLVLLLIFVLAVFGHWLDGRLNLPVLMNNIRKKNDPGNVPDDSFVSSAIGMILTLTMVGMSIILSVGQKIRRDQAAGELLEKEKISSELSFLKAQINPHFFFNILHTIYGLTDTNINIAKESIYTLSQMMRYVLYETKNDLTTLEKEIDFVDGYIRLMQLRLNDQAQVIFDKPKHLQNIDLAPMLFLPFVENAFKHGISSLHPSYVYVGIFQTGNTLKIEVRNTVFPEKSENLEESNGIGLANTKRRLDLIYPGKYSLLVNDNKIEGEFNIQLKLYGI